MTASHDTLIGQQIGGYVIQRRLAEGGMGEVYFAQHAKLGTAKAVKVLLPMYAENADLRARFEREATAASKMKHRHIVAIDDYGQLPDGQLYLLMPFLSPGRSLDAHMQARGLLSELEALHLLAQAALALDYMHRIGFLHRDIKPSNIFIVDEPDDPLHVYLIDLGLAKGVGQLGVTHAGGVVGTPEYMAVEQFADPMGITPQADIFALAIVAWEIVTGERPWGEAPSLPDLYQRKLNQAPHAHALLSPGWFHVLSSALSPRPVTRPRTAGELVYRLAASVSGGPDVLHRTAPSIVSHAQSDSVTLQRDVTPPPLSLVSAPPYQAHPTTLSSSIGVAPPRPAAPPPTRQRRAVAAIAVVLCGAAAAFTATRLRAPTEGSRTTAQPVTLPAGTPVELATHASLDAGFSADAFTEDAPTAVDGGVSADASVRNGASDVALPHPSQRKPQSEPSHILDTRSQRDTSAPPPRKLTKPEPARVDNAVEKPVKPKFNPNAPLGGEGT